MLLKLLNRRTAILASALAGAFVLGAAFEHLRPRSWLSPADKTDYADIITQLKTPRVLARCMAAGITVPEVPSDPRDEDGDRRSYVMACMRGEGYEYDTLGEVGGGRCEFDGYYGNYKLEGCYRRARW